MKLNRFFMLGLAGLAFAACSNEEEVVNNGPQFNGNGAVSISFSSLGTKGLANPSQDGSIQVKGDITVTLYYKDSDGDAQTQSITLKSTQISDDTKYTFWNIASPDSVTASVNGGKNYYGNDAITTLQVDPVAIPAFGSTKTFTLTNNTGTPDFENQNDPEKGTGTETGATKEEDEGKVYQLFNASVNMVIPVARLEVSGITHKAHGEGEQCDYKTLTIKGVYMDKLYTKGGRLVTGSSAFTAGSAIQDYCWKANQTPSLGTGLDAILSDNITDDDAVGDNFLEDKATWPKETGKVFAYNFYAGAENPIFKIYFDSSESNNASKPLPAPRYAMITNYKTTSGDPVTFTNGKVYRITKAELVDGNILGDEGGNTLYGVEVTVQEATWSVVDIEADWAN